MQIFETASVDEILVDYEGEAGSCWDRTIFVRYTEEGWNDQRRGLPFHDPCTRKPMNSFLILHHFDFSRLFHNCRINMIFFKWKIPGKDVSLLFIAIDSRERLSRIGRNVFHRLRVRYVYKCIMSTNEIHCLCWECRQDSLRAGNSEITDYYKFDVHVCFQRSTLLNCWRIS